MNKRNRLIIIALLTGLAVPAAGSAASSGYSVRYHVQFDHGRTAPIYVGDPLQVELRGAGKTGERYDVCWTPAPIERGSCYRNLRVNGPGSLGAPSKAGKLKLRFKLRDSGRVIVRSIRVLDPRERS